jgi:hypothetical protein
MIYFAGHMDPEKRIRKRVEDFSNHSGISDARRDAYTLYLPILDEPFVTIDTTVDSLKASVRALERVNCPYAKIMAIY